MQVEAAVPELTPRAVDLSAIATPSADDEAVRAHTYSLLGALLVAPPQRDLLDVLAAIEVPSGAAQDFAESWRVLALTAAQADVTNVDDEYHDLFIGLGRGQVMPYGSWYLTGFLMDRPLAALRADLDALGIERQADVREPEDHAGALCESMAMLIAGSLALPEQQRFFNAHMAPWMSTFLTDLREAKAARFYKAVAALGTRFIEFEIRYLGMSV